MKRKVSLKRRTPVKRVNRERAAKRKARDFGEYAEWIRRQPCCVRAAVSDWYAIVANRLALATTDHRERHLFFCSRADLAIDPDRTVWQRPSQAAHVRSRGAGGHADVNLVALCRFHHAEQHRVGIKSFQKKYSVDLGAIAADLWGRYQRETKGDVA